MKKYYGRNCFFFCTQFFIVAKSFPRKLFGWKNVWLKFFGQIFFIFAKSFLRKQDEKNFCRKFFYSCKIISSETGWKKFVENFLLLQNDFPGNLMKKIFVQFFFGRKFCIVANSFPPKLFGWRVLVENFFDRKLFVAKSNPRKLFGWKQF